MQKFVYLCFMGYAKTFDKVQHKEPFEMLGNLDLFRYDFRKIQN